MSGLRLIRLSDVAPRSYPKGNGNELTITQIFELEPRLADVAEIAKYRSDFQLPACRAYGKAKADCDPYVGWHAREERLRSQAAYQTFMAYIRVILNYYP